VQQSPPEGGVGVALKATSVGASVAVGAAVGVRVAASHRQLAEQSVVAWPTQKTSHARLQQSESTVHTHSSHVASLQPCSTRGSQHSL
jgi:hypothetical protein